MLTLFTVVGLEAQAAAFSSGVNGVTNYLALPPQVNTPNIVTSRSSGATELDAMRKMQALEPHGTSIPRCWIHTHTQD